MQSERSQTRQAFVAAIPVILGYIPLGLSCGLLSAKAGLLPVQVLLLCVFLYAGGGQFMIASMVFSGVPPLSIAASVTLINARYMLYSSASANYFAGDNRSAAFVYGYEITDESFGVNNQRFCSEQWCVKRARMVNTFSHLSWTISNLIGVYAGGMIPIALPVVAFSMTSMFLCLLCMQKRTKSNVRAAAFAAAAVILCKLIGLSKIAILAGSLVGIAGGILFSKRREEDLDEVA